MPSSTVATYRCGRWIASEYHVWRDGSKRTTWMRCARPAPAPARGSQVSPTLCGDRSMKLLHLDSSILGANSVSRALSADIVARQVALNPGIEVIYRDLAAEPPLHLTGAHLAAWQGSLVAD